MADKFTCPHWRPGQRCKPYFETQTGRRLAIAVVGASLAIATPGVELY